MKRSAAYHQSLEKASKPRFTCLTICGFEKRPPWPWCLIMGGDNSIGLFEMTHLPDKSTQACNAVRFAGCVATGSWNLFPFVAAGCSEGRLQLRSRWVLEKSAVPSPLSFIPVGGDACPPLVRRSVWQIRLAGHRALQWIHSVIILMREGS